jgi:hypothetical protein
MYGHQELPVLASMQTSLEVAGADRGKDASAVQFSPYAQPARCPEPIMTEPKARSAASRRSESSPNKSTRWLGYSDE